MLGQGCSQRREVCEVFGPSLDGTDVVLNVFTDVENLWNLETNEEELQYSLDDVIPATVFEIIDCCDKLLLHLWGISLDHVDAGLDFGQVVVLGHTIEEACKHFVDVATWDRHGLVVAQRGCWCLVHWSHGESD